MTDTNCSLCSAANNLGRYDVPDSPAPEHITLCGTCRAQIESGALDTHHFQALTTSMWSEAPAVQVMAYRLLTQLSSESWAADALDMLYLDEPTKAWAEAGVKASSQSQPVRDANGAILNAGDSVTLIKDLAVKGAGFTAKRGTIVRGISLTDNPLHIEGRVNGQRIVLVSAFLKKSA